jgi:SAM-dependent methyltransferase
MTTTVDRQDWRVVDAGWGHAAVDFATLSEPGNCREYVALHHRLAVGDGDRLLDIACGAGLAVELATLRGAACAGIDASPRLIAIARDRNPDADLRAGDMAALPWPDATFDVVTSFRGIWATTEHAVVEMLRVLRPGGRAGLTVWGHLKASPDSWALAPLRLAAPDVVGRQAAMVRLGRTGAGEALLAAVGFVDVVRVDLPFVWEFADPETFARALASTGPAYEAMQHAGADAFRAAAIATAQSRVRDGLPLRAHLPVVAYLARKAVQP